MVSIYQFLRKDMEERGKYIFYKRFRVVKVLKRNFNRFGYRGLYQKGLPFQAAP